MPRRRVKAFRDKVEQDGAVPTRVNRASMAAPLCCARPSAQAVRTTARPVIPRLPWLCVDGLESLRGPTSTSNWVVPGLLLCGSEPDGATAALLVRECGVSCFCCLQAELPDPPPYQHGLESGHDVEFARLSTADGQVFDDTCLVELLAALTQKLTSGTVVYVHCRGGHGRTGVVVAGLLGMLYPELPAREALRRIQLYHDVRLNPRGELLQAPMSPQTAAQKAQAVRVLDETRAKHSLLRPIRSLLSPWV